MTPTPWDGLPEPYDTEETTMTFPQTRRLIGGWGPNRLFVLLGWSNGAIKVMAPNGFITFWSPAFVASHTAPGRP